MNRVLVVEDDRLLARTVTRSLKSAGFDVDVVHSISDARAQMEQRVDLILLDVKLPDGSGVEVAELALSLTPTPIIIAMTGTAPRAQILTLGQLGVLAVLEKPFTTSDLLEAVERCGATTIARINSAVWVGREPMNGVLGWVRSDMTIQALALTGGNKANAAKLLGVSRQAVQQVSRHKRGG